MKSILIGFFVLLTVLNIAAQKNGEMPPGDALTMTPSVARLLVRDSLKRETYMGKWTLRDVGTVHVSQDELSFETAAIAWLSLSPSQYRTNNLVFKDVDYSTVRTAREKGELFFIVRWSARLKDNMDDHFKWKDEKDAKQFSDAVNLLIYKAHRQPADPDDFINKARAWLERPELRPKPPVGWEKHRVLAEQRIKERDILSALVNYEAGLVAYPMWPEGWFNAALLYAELGEFESAADRMRHYLELAPDAPDAKAAREKVIVWEDKAKP